MPDQDARTSSSLLLRIRDVTEQGSWEQFVRLYDPIIRRYLGWQGVSGQDADDLVQEVLMIVMRRMSTFQYDPRQGRFRGWLHTVTRNRLRRHLIERRRAHLSPGGSADHEMLQRLAGPDGGLDDRWQREHDRRRLELALQSVRQAERENKWLCFQLTVLEGLPPSEVATRLGIRVGQVHLNKFRIRMRIQAELSRLGDDE
jgi:RNA polymerase sigma factor (sigma-70 family)